MDSKEYQRQRYYRNRDKINVALKQKITTLKCIALLAYGGKCTICNEERVGCLHLDHINNDGAEHRASIGLKTTKGGYRFYKWVVDQIAEIGCPPSGLQVLCANCHALKHSPYPEQHPIYVLQGLPNVIKSDCIESLG